MITIVGLGMEKNDLSLRGAEAIRSAKTVLLRTAQTASAESVKALGVPYASLDSVYEKSRNFDSLQKNIVAEVLRAAKEGDVAYCVDGSLSEDAAARILCKRKNDVVCVDGVSKAAYFAAKAGCAQYTAMSAYDRASYRRAALPLIVYDIDSAFLAGDLKLALSDLLGEESEVLFFHGGEGRKMPLYEIDRQGEYDYCTAIAALPVPLLRKKRFDYTDLEDLVRLLRAPGGCPWDRAQTNESIRSNMVEEAYELVDAIDSKDDDKIREETGDVLLQAAFHTVMKEELDAFDSSDVITELCSKLIFRHSHIFGEDKAQNEAEALSFWEKNKTVEKHQDTFSSAVLDVPKGFPALMRAQKVGKRAGKSGMDFASAEDAAAQIGKEVEEFLEAYRAGDAAHTAEELGDVLFAAVNAGRKAGVDCEFALKETVGKFVRRFVKTEELAKADGFALNELDAETLDRYYRRAKELCGQDR